MADRALPLRPNDLARGRSRAQGYCMQFVQRLRTAWDCRECRLYRRVALLLLAAALLTWLAASVV
jgi:hypothetical protein